MSRKGSRGKSACKENEIKKRAQTIKYLGENVKLSLLLQKILNGMEYETYANSLTLQLNRVIQRCNEDLFNE